MSPDARTPVVEAAAEESRSSRVETWPRERQAPTSSWPERERDLEGGSIGPEPLAWADRDLGVGNCRNDRGPGLADPAFAALRDSRTLRRKPDGRETRLGRAASVGRRGAGPTPRRAWGPGAPGRPARAQPSIATRTRASRSARAQVAIREFRPRAVDVCAAVCVLCAAPQSAWSARAARSRALADFDIAPLWHARRSVPTQRHGASPGCGGRGARAGAYG